MFTLFKNGQVFKDGEFHELSLLTAFGKIAHVGAVNEKDLLPYDLEIVDCKNHFITPGFIDSQALLAGGSGESGFLSQSPRILIEECVRGGVTTTIGTIGTDTITKTMSNLFASVRAYKEAGMSAYCYTGGYELPPQTLTGSLRSDILFVDEIIGVGETAIADARAPEPTIHELARAVSESYVAGFLSGKAGVTRIHVGGGKRRLQTVREMADQHEIKFESLYFTHIERTKELVLEGIELARRGSYLDFDIQDNDMQDWYRFYLESDGPLDQLSFSSDAGVSSPEEIWNEIRKCSRLDRCCFAQMIPHMTTVPAKALKLKNKAYLDKNFDADILVISKEDLELKHVMANGKFFLKNKHLIREAQTYTSRRKTDWYGHAP